MNPTDVPARAKLAALGIAPEPAIHPIAAPPKAGQPVAPTYDKAKAAEIVERARAVSVSPAASVADVLARARSAAVVPPPSPAPPQLIKRRVEIMVTGSVSRVGVVRHALNDLQAQLFQQLGNDHLELRVTAFLDGCRHTTPWSRSPIDAGSQTNSWHCFQGETGYAEAFGHTSSETDPVDAIVMFGDRFDDDLRQSLEIAEQLRQRGTRIYAFHIRGTSRTRHAYEQLAERTGGAFVQLTNHHAFARLMPVIADYLVRPVEALRALPPSHGGEVRVLIERLKKQPLPPALRLTWRQP